MKQKIGQKTKHTFIPKTSLSHHPEPHLKSTSELFPSQSSPQMQLQLQVSSSQWDPSQLPGQSMGRNPSSRSRNASGELPSLFLRRCQLQLRLICGSPTWEPNYYRVLPLPYKLLCSHKSLSQLERRDAGAPLSCSSCSQLFPGSQSLPFGRIINQERRTRSFCSSCCAPSTAEWGIPKNPSLHQEFRGE